MKNKWGPLNGGNLTPCRQLRYLFALSCRAARREALLCCAKVGLSPIRSAFWRPVVRCSAAGECGAPWPCGLVVARPAGGGGCVAGARVGGLEPSAPQRVAPSCAQCAAVALSLCSVWSLAAACRCSSNGSTLTNCPKLSPLANTGN